jgi:hypothetical protein
VKQTTIALTDNKSYAVHVDIFPDGGVGFWVSSTRGELEPTKLNKIMAKVLSIGFKEDSFYYLDAKCAELFILDMRGGPKNEL